MYKSVLYTWSHVHWNISSLYCLENALKLNTYITRYHHILFTIHTAIHTVTHTNKCTSYSLANTVRAFTVTYMKDIRGCSGNKIAGPISREHPWVTSCSGLPMHGSMSRLPLFIMHTNSSPSAVQAMSVIHHAL